MENTQYAVLRICNLKTETRYEEPALIAYHIQTHKVLAVGKEAMSYLDHREEQIQVSCPFQDGSITDFDPALAILQNIISKVYKRKLLQPLHMAICIPKDINAVNRRVFSDVLHQAGAKEITLSQDSFAQTKAALPSSYSILLEIVQAPSNSSKLYEIPFQAYKFAHKSYIIDHMMPDQENWIITLKHHDAFLQLTFPQVHTIQIQTAKEEVIPTDTHILYQIQKESSSKDSQYQFLLVCAPYRIKITCREIPTILSKSIPS